VQNQLTAADLVQVQAAGPPVLATSEPWTVCGISRAQWFKLSSSSQTPQPVRLGKRKPVWVIAELEAWLRAGAPCRDRWELMKLAEMKR
jgi:predicted DNA-binding transcriptional regulator AlpA